jgi:hypothetical protein
LIDAGKEPAMAVTGGNYDLAMSVMNNLVGARFLELRAETVKSKPDAAAVDRLREQFQDAYGQRERLVFADDVVLQTIIKDLGPQARAAAARAKQAA